VLLFVTGVEDEVKDVPLVESSIQPTVVRLVLPSAQAKEVTSGIKVGKTTKVLGKIPPPVVAVKVAVWVEAPEPTAIMALYAVLCPDPVVNLTTRVSPGLIGREVPEAGTVTKPAPATLA
jgi:hypothetical protein